MDSVLIDTDVIIDFFLDREPFSDFATEVLSLCERKEITGYVTPVIISNTYYILRTTAKHEKVIEKLRLLMSILDVLSMDKKIIEHALNSNFKDFEDALQNFAAEQNQKVKVVLTRNLKDYKNSALSVMTPESYLNSLK